MRKLYFVHSKKYVQKIFFIYLIFLSIQGYCDTALNFNNKTGNNLYHSLSDPWQRNEIMAFVRNVLRQCNPDIFLKIIKESTSSQPPMENTTIYQILRERAHEAQSYPHFWNKINALRYQQKTLQAQLNQLINNKKPVKHYIEIGTPGTYITPLKNLLLIGQITLINDKKSFIDYVHSWSLNPLKLFKAYDHFIPLNNYDPISEHSVPNNSVNLISCLIGFHHIPQEKIVPFIKSIYRVLAPGGILIFREHNVLNENTKSIVQAAHSIFNVFSSESSLEDEINEYRNFHSLKYWINALKEIGFEEIPQHLLQEGDPTLNTLLSLKKPAQGIEEIEEEINNIPEFNRNLTNTFLSTPEWHNVLTADEYARFIHHTPFYDFPYMSCIASFWEVFSNSWQQARQYQSLWEVLTTDYTMMNIFIGIFTTIEYSIKALVSAPVRFFVSGEEAREIQFLLYGPTQKLKKMTADLKILESYGGNFVRVQAPRYKEFQNIILSLLEQDEIEILNIAGNKKIQITLKHEKALSNEILSHPGNTLAYQWKFPTIPKNTFSAVIVNLKELKDFYRLLKDNGIEIFYIHDF